jgi:hypothetical protein
MAAFAVKSFGCFARDRAFSVKTGGDGLQDRLERVTPGRSPRGIRL